MYINPLFPSLFWMKGGCTVQVEPLRMWFNDHGNIKTPRQNNFFMEGQFGFLTGLTDEVGYFSNRAKFTPQNLIREPNIQ